MKKLLLCIMALVASVLLSSCINDSQNTEKVIIGKRPLGNPALLFFPLPEMREEQTKKAKHLARRPLKLVKSLIGPQNFGSNGFRQHALRLQKYLSFAPLRKSSAKIFSGNNDTSIGISGGFNYNKGEEQSVAMKRSQDAFLVVETLLGKFAKDWKINLRANIGYSDRPFVLKHGEVMSDYLVMGLSFNTYANFYSSYSVYLDLGMEVEKNLTHNYTSYENNKAYAIKMKKWVPLIKVSLGLEQNMGKWGDYFFELGFKHSLTAPLEKNTLLISHDTTSARDIEILSQKQWVYFFSVGWKLGVF